MIKCIYKYQEGTKIRVNFRAIAWVKNQFSTHPKQILNAYKISKEA